MTITIYSKFSNALTFENVASINETVNYLEFDLGDGQDPIRMYRNWIYRIEIAQNKKVRTHVRTFWPAAELSEYFEFNFRG